MALNPADIATASRLLDEALALPPAERDAWLAALPPEHRHLAPALRDMLAAEADLTRDDPLASLPHLNPVDDSVALAGQRIGPYRLLHEIGRGGMGSVWLAERADGSFERQVALKLPRLTWAEGLAQRMAREQRIGARLEHPAIARLYDAGLDERGRPYLALEYIEGQPIDVWCRERRLDIRGRLRLFVQVVRAVAYAHGRLVVHRDLKPGNVLVSADGQAHLLDFGIAKLLEPETGPGLTQEQGRVMTPQYASPEQVVGEPITLQSDVYSLGVLLYELLTGVLPFEGRRNTMGALEDAILQGDVPLASSRPHDRTTAKALRGDVDSIVAKAMQRDLERRYGTADALAVDIERYLAGETVSARPDSTGYRLRKALRRHWVGFGATAAVVVAVFAGGGVALLQVHRASKAVERQRLVTEFVSDVFRLKRPLGAQASDGLMGDALLRRSAMLVSQKFQDEPSVQAQMYGVIANMFLEIGVGDQAAQYARRQVDLLQSSGADDRTLFPPVLLMARGFVLSDDPVAAESQARRALTLAGTDLGRQLDAMAELAQALMWGGNNSECLLLLDRMAAVAKTHGQPTIAEAWGYSVRGSTLSSMDRYPESGAWHEKGIQLARQLEGPDSTTVLRMLGQRGWQMINHGEAKAAYPLLVESHDAARRKGGTFPLLTASRRAVEWARLYSAGVVDYQEAKEVVEDVVGILAREPALPDRYRCRAAYQRGALSLWWGDLADAMRWMPPNADCGTPPDGSPRLRFQTAASMAVLFLHVGETAEAERWIQEQARTRASMGESKHPYAVWDYVARAQALSMDGRTAEAVAVLDEASTQVPDKMGSSIRSPSDVIRVARARMLADHQQSREAWELVRQRPPDAQTELWWSASLPLYSELECRHGKPTEGRTRLEAAIARATKRVSPHDPKIAWARAIAGQCALADGDRVSASRLAREAREAFVAQPKVAAYFKAPLAELERALGLKLPPV